MWRSPPKPDLGWARPALAVFVGVLGPALPAALFLWLLDTDIGRIDGPVLQALWFVAACLMAAPLLAWIAFPLSIPLVRFAARRGWAGPCSLCALALLIGLPLAHIILNGDLTREAPAMIPVLACTLCIQALCGWIILHSRKNIATTPATSETAQH